MDAAKAPKTAAEKLSTLDKLNAEIAPKALRVDIIARQLLRAWSMPHSEVSALIAERDQLCRELRALRGRVARLLRLARQRARG